MRKFKLFCLIVLISFVAFIAISLSASAQERVSYRMVDGQVTAVKKAEKAPKAKTPDEVVTVIDGVTFYRGSKGAVYCIKVSKKTGKEYKQYVKTEKQ